MLAALIGVLGWRALEPGADPVLQPGHARALQDLEQVAAHQGRVWDWWSYGYAAQYYSGLPTLADGGNTSRARIFALGQVFGAENPLQAAQIMKLGAMARVAQTSRSTEWRTAAYAAHPLDRLENLPAAAAQRELDGLGERRRLWPEALPDEFLVLSWSTLRQVQWVSYFSRWTLTGGPAGYGQVMTLRPPVRLDEEQGLLHTPEGVVPLISVDILDDGSHYRNRWPRDEGAHAVINNASGEGVLMDSSLYRMMAVQMLIGDPAAFDEHFELVSDRFPGRKNLSRALISQGRAKMRDRLRWPRRGRADTGNQPSDLPGSIWPSQGSGSLAIPAAYISQRTIGRGPRRFDRPILRSDRG